LTDKNEEPKPIARLVAMLFKTVLHQQLELAALRQLREAKGVITLDELAEAVAREEADLSSLVELEALVDEDVRVLVEELKRRGRSERRHPRPEVRRPEHRRRGEVRHAAGRAYEAYATRKGWTVADEHVYSDDGISGAEFLKRSGFRRLMNSLKPRPPFQVLVMSEESRLGRERIEMAYVLKQITDAGDG
jgi:Resolvase, N terminal domain